MAGWTTSELQEVGTDMYDISQVNMQKFFELVTKLFVEVVLQKDNVNYSNIRIDTSVDLLNIIQVSYLDKTYGVFICSKERMLDPLKGIFTPPDRDWETIRILL